MWKIGLDTGKHGASLTLGEPGVLHGFYSYMLQDEAGNPLEAYSISAGLDYPGVGPEHSYLKDEGIVRYDAVTDAEALDAFALLCRTEGIIPAIESSHALALLHRLAQELGPRGIRVNVVSAGVVDTDALKYFPNREQLLAEYARRTPAGPTLTPEDVAGAVYLLCLPEAAMINGRRYSIDGPVLKVHRLRFADNVPMMLEIRYISLALCPGADKLDLTGSLYDIYRSRYGRELTEIHQMLSTQTMEEESSPPLSMEAGGPTRRSRADTAWKRRSRYSCA